MSSLLDYEAGRLEGHGNDYQRLVACMLLLKLTLEKRAFKLGFEMKCATKFDDVVLCLRNVWYLIQTKHCQPTSEEKDTTLTKEMFFKREGDFSLVKYLKGFDEMKNGRNRWVYGDVKQLILMTNRNLDESTFGASDYREVEPNEMLNFSQGKHIQLINQEMEIINLLKEDALKRDLNNIRSAMENLFKNGKMSQILLVYNEYLKAILVVNGQQVKLAEPKTITNSDLVKLCIDLHKQFKNKIVALSAMGNFWTNTENLIKINVERCTIDEFCSKLVVSVSQPNVDKLERDLLSTARRWMRSWIQPDDLGRLEESFFELPLSVVRKQLKEYEKPKPKRDGEGKLKNMKDFLQNHDGERMLSKMTERLESEVKKISKRSCASLRAMEHYYISRHLHRFDSGGNMSDNEFVRQICSDCANRNYNVITAPPGMGKSTLMQYLAFEVQKLDPAKAVYLIYLNNLQGDLPNFSQIEDLVSSDIFSFELTSENIELIANDDKTEIIMFLDAFDELREVNQNKIQQLIDLLLKKSNITVIISGRNHVRDQLFNDRDAVSYDVQAFSKTDQRIFFEKYWKNSAENKIKFNEFSGKILNKFNNEISSQEKDLIGVPLMTRMVAEIYAGSFDHYLNSEDDLEQYIPERKFTIDSLYEQFVRTCNKITMNKKYNVNNNVEPDAFFNPMLKDIEFNYQVFAVENFFSNQFIAFISDKRYHDTLRSFQTRIGNEQSLLIEIVAEVPSFLHLSFREYLAAKYLFEVIGQTKNCLYKNEIFNNLRQHENVKNFLLAMINSNIDHNSCFSKLSKANKNRLRLLKQLGEDVVFAACKMDFSISVQFLHHLHEPFTFESIRDGDGKSVLELAHVSGARKVETFLLDILKKGTECKNPLHFAVESDHFEFVQELVSLKVNINSTDKFGNTPLFRVKSGNIFNFLITSGANLNAKNQKGETPLHWASKMGNLELVKLLAESGATMNEKTNDEETPLDYSVENFHSDIVRYLLNECKAAKSETNFAANMAELLASKFADVGFPSEIDEVRMPWRINSGTKNQQIFTNVTETCLLIGMQVDSTDKHGNTAFHIAAKHDCCEAVQLLLNHKAAVNIQNEEGFTPLMNAAMYVPCKVVELLACHVDDFSLRNKNGDTILHFAARFENCLPALIDRYEQFPHLLDAQNRSGQTALHLAIKFQCEKNVQLLLDAGADMSLAMSHESAASMFINSADMIQCVIKNAAKSLDKLGFLIHNAAFFECPEYIKMLIDANVDVNLKNDIDETALHIAAAHENYNVVKLLLDHEADVDSREIDGQTPLYIAANTDNLNIIKLLLEGNASVNVSDIHGLTPLHIAARNDSLNAINLLLEYNANPNSQDKYGHNPLRYCTKKLIFDRLVSAGADQTLKDSEDNTELHIAVIHNSCELVKHFAENNPRNIDCKNKSGLTPLHCASMHGYDEIVQLLINYNANLHVRDLQDETALFKAICVNQVRVVQCLLRHLSTNDLSNHKDLLHKTIQLPHQEQIVKLLIEAGCDINAIDGTGRTPLHIASKSSNLYIFKLLVDSGADVDALDAEGNSALHYAVEHWSAHRIVNYLVEHSATIINVKNVNGETPLHRSVSASYTDASVTRMLIAKNACIHVADKQGNTALHLAISRGREDLAMNLACLSPELDRQNKKGETALHLAILSGNFSIVKNLTEKGTDLRIKTVEGKTVLDLAQENQFMEIYEYLKNKID